MHTLHNILHCAYDACFLIKITLISATSATSAFTPLNIWFADGYQIPVDVQLFPTFYFSNKKLKAISDRLKASFVSFRFQVFYKYLFMKSFYVVDKIVLVTQSATNLFYPTHPPPLKTITTHTHFTHPSSPQNRLFTHTQFVHLCPSLSFLINQTFHALHLILRTSINRELNRLTYVRSRNRTGTDAVKGFQWC